jgi:N-methylhydantoinase A
LRAAADIGGTFTDLVFLDETNGTMGTTKSPTTPKDFSNGVVQTIKQAGFDVPSTTFFVHGTTVVINAITERRGAKTGLITTGGFRDVLEITRANRPDLYNLSYKKPTPFVPRRHRLEVRERINHKGEVLIPLEEKDVRKALDFLLQEEIEAIAVCFLHSYANPEHERRCGEIIRREAPGIALTLSCDISREWREYERTNTAVLNSYVKQKTTMYLNNLETTLTKTGMGKIFHVMQSNGGTATFTQGKKAPINMVESGPVGGVIGAAAVAALIGERDAISFDVGGTTAKTSLISGGKPGITTKYIIEWSPAFAGYPILAPTVDIVEIGAGGGSIAWIDNAGGLNIGPQSAGAEPGPASYGSGGTKPTVTDANVLAGRINPDYFLGGKIPLYPDCAEKALRPVAEAFGISITDAAMGVIRLADANMVNALKLVSVRRGYDPRDFVMVAYGGGGAVHAGALARELRCKKVIVPTHPAVFSAWGMLAADLRQDILRTQIMRTDRVDPAVIESFYREMEEEAMLLMTEQHISKENVLFQRSADLRYAGQEHTVKTPAPAGGIDERNLQILRDEFHRLHEQSYAFRLDAPVEIVNYHLSCFGVTEKPKLDTIKSAEGEKIVPPADTLEGAKKGTRTVNFDELGYQETPVYERDRFPFLSAAGGPVRGPMVIEEPSSTTVVFPDQEVFRDEYGFLQITNIGGELKR